MKRIEVVAAVILRDGKVFATQRGYGPWKDWWEFPGGKIEAGESPQVALKREIREELKVDIQVGGFIDTIEWDYPEFHLTLHCYFCSLESGEPTLLEHESAAWVDSEGIGSLKWLPADESLVLSLSRFLAAK